MFEPWGTHAGPSSSQHRPWGGGLWAHRSRAALPAVVPTSEAAPLHQTVRRMSWPRSQRLRLLGVWALVVSMLAIRAFAAGVLARSEDLLRPKLQCLSIDVNRAGVGELAALPGIGPTRAAAVVLDRVRHGPFRRLSDLVRVDGIGADTVSRLQPFARVETADLVR